jgi:hypothetical protein
MLANHPLITASDKLYFAYGSNLSPEQMARRCPDSIFLGKATLRGYRWQINERGVANIVAAPAPALKKGGTKERSSRRSSDSAARGRSRDHHADDEGNIDSSVVVEGLLYALSDADERRLDEYEGVEKGRYEKYSARLDFEPVRGNVFARCTSASVARALREEREQHKIAEVLGLGSERRARSWDEGEGEKRRSGSRRDGGGGGGRRGASVGASSSSSSALSGVGSGGLRSSILGLLGIPTSSNHTRTRRSASPSPARGRGMAEPRVSSTPVVALMYASTTHVRDDEVRERYVPRMERAVADAVALGVSRGFIEEYIAPRVFRNRPDWGSSWRKSLMGAEDGIDKDKGWREVRSSRRSASRSCGSVRHGRRDSILDVRGD